MSKIKLILANQATEIQQVFSNTKEELLILTPWIKTIGAKLILSSITSKNIHLILVTRIDISDFVKGSSDIEAIRLCFDHLENFSLKPLPNLHAKVYISDDKSAVVTSGNLTFGGLQNNIEAGILINDHEYVKELKKNLLEILGESDLIPVQKFIEVEKLVAEAKINKPAPNSYERDNYTNVSFGKRIVLEDDTNLSVLKNIRQEFNIEVVPLEKEKIEWILGDYGKKVINDLSKSISEIRQFSPEILEAALVSSPYIISKL